MFYHGLAPGVSTGWHTLDEYYTVRKKQFSAITGSPGTGKSLLVDNAQVNLNQQFGWKHLNFNAETQPVELNVKSIADIWLNKPFTRKHTSEEEYFATLAFVQNHFRFADLEESEWTVDGLLEKADAMREHGYDFDTLTIDPWNELEHRRPQAMNETEYISWALSKLRRYARKNDIHLFVIAHPAKPRKVSVTHKDTSSLEQMTKQVYPVPSLYDISGSAHWYNKCDNGIVLWRDLSDKSAPTEVLIEKVKFRNCGKRGKGFLWYDHISTKLFDIPANCRHAGEGV